MASGLLERMKRNPAGVWQIRDVEAICRKYGLLFRPGKAHRIAMRSILQRRKF